MAFGIEIPMESIAKTILAHIQEVFKHNYEEGNFDLNPETEMYIRADYPESDQEVGLKPSIVVRGLGGLQDYRLSIGVHNFLSIERSVLEQNWEHDDVYVGQIIFRTIAEKDSEALTLAYLTMLSINKFKHYLFGKNGIIDIHATNISDSQPYKAGGHYDAFACEVQVQYAMVGGFNTTSTRPIIEGVNQSIKY